MNDPKTTDYFELFGLESTFEVDHTQLESRFRELQQEFHPDRSAGGDEKRKLQSLRMTSLVNDAYQTLSSPLKRAGYLLLKNGVDPEKNDQSHLGSEFLLKQMQLREKLEEIESREALDELDALKKEVANEQQELISTLHTLLDEGRFEQAKPLYNKLQFAVKLLDEINKAEELLLDY